MSSPRDDLIDATYIAAVFNAAREWELATGKASPQKPLREAVWFVWQQPRMTRPLLRSKYPVAGPWTAAARAAVAADPKCPLVIEHVVPMARLIRHLLDNAIAPHELAVLLADSLTTCVVTTEENKLLAAAGIADSMLPDRGTDAWTRYRLAGIDIEGIAPLRG